MICSKCGRTIDKEALFCQWCGASVKTAELEDWGLRIIHFRKQNNDVEMARLIYEIYKNDLYLSKYASFAAFGEEALGLKRAQIYNYKWVGERFFDKDGKFLINGGNQWGIGKLNELRPLSVKKINILIARGVIYPGMSSKALRCIAQEYKDVDP